MYSLCCIELIDFVINKCNLLLIFLKIFFFLEKLLASIWYVDLRLSCSFIRSSSFFISCCSALFNFSNASFSFSTFLFKSERVDERSSFLFSFRIFSALNSFNYLLMSYSSRLLLACVRCFVLLLPFHSQFFHNVMQFFVYFP